MAGDVPTVRLPAVRLPEGRQPGPAAPGEETDGLSALVAAVSGTARALGHAHLADGLDQQIALATHASARVAFLGEFGAGRSAVVNGLIGVPVCGVSATRSTTITTIVRWAPEPTATLCRLVDGVLDRRDVPLAEAPGLSLTPPEESTATWLEIGLPRGLLADGFELIDLPGLGGGMAAPQAATLLRGLEDADIALYVADAAAELTTTDLDLITAAAAVCPALAVVLTRTDLHPHWRRIADIDRRHLADAGLDGPVVPVSAPLRALAVRTGDPALHAESGFSVLVAMLGGRLGADRRAGLRRRCAAAVADVLTRLDQHLDAEATALDAAPGSPAGGQSALAAAQARAEGARALIDSASRWRELLADRFGEARRLLHADLVERRRRVRDELTTELEELDPAREWDEFVPWMTALVNTHLAEHRRALVGARERIAQAVADRLEADAGDLPTEPVGDPGRVAAPGVLGAPAAQGETPELDLPALTTRKVTRVDLTMNAVRGMTLGSSVGGIAMTLAPAGLLPSVVLPFTWPLVAIIGATFAVRSVRGAREAALTSARIEARRLALGAADDAFVDAQSADEDSLARTYEALRDHFGVLAQRVHLSAIATLDAAQEALQVEGQAAGERLVQVRRSREQVARWAYLLDRAATELGPAPAAPAVPGPAGSSGPGASAVPGPARTGASS